MRAFPTDWRRALGLGAVTSAVLLGPGLVGAAGAQPAPATPSQCVTCHATLADAAAARDVADDVHGKRGFGCVDCHGGDATATDRTAAHDVKKGYRGVLTGQAIVATCTKCHADAAFMRTYAPAQRVDQGAEYATSVHGQRLATGDSKVATCASCHGAHGIRAVRDAKSPVYPTNVAATCAKCHADATHMAGYKVAGGPLPTTQYADYQKSVHYAAMTKQQDLAAPTCNDCHGNHGAAPPGVGAVANVCGTCHAVFAERFALSTHKDVFDRGCVECHSNHAVLKPSDELLGAGKDTLCATCHEDDAGAKAATAMRASIDSLRTSVDRASSLVAELHNAGLEVGEQEIALREAQNHVTLTRTELHTWHEENVKKVVDDGLAITAKIEAAAQQGRNELRYRRTGLAVSMIAILLVVVALVLKIRDIEHRQAG
ncbi:MAG: cytochrome c3 family protein [Vicinamibacterales bacterium]